MAAKKPPEQTRRPNRGSLTILPPDGPDEKPPKWPLKTPPTADEKAIWVELWTSQPQAHAWHQLKSYRVVARYVRILARVEDLGSTGSGVNWQTEARQLESALGLSPRAAHLLNYRIGEVQAAPLASVTDLEAQLKKAGGAK